MIDPIKEAFTKVKEDMNNLRNQISSLNLQIEEIKSLINNLIKPTNQQTDAPTDKQTENIAPTQTDKPTNIPTDEISYKGLKSQFSEVFIGNEGVPTDKQTNQQTDKQTEKEPIKPKKDQISGFSQNISLILSSLDNLKSEVIKKLISLTPQELNFFATVYQLQEENLQVNYPLLAKKMSLSEGSMRDYTLKIIKKGLPLQKTKLNNKKIILTIPEDFRKIISLKTLLTIQESLQF